MPVRPPHPSISNDSRYPTADEQAALRAFAADLPARARAAAAAEKAEDGVFAAALAALGREHPQWAGGAAWPAGLQAERAAVRYAAHALVFDEDSLFLGKGLDWCREVHRAAGVPPEVARRAFGLVRDGPGVTRAG